MKYQIAILMAVIFCLPTTVIAEQLHAGGCPEGRPCPEIKQPHVEGLHAGGCPEGPPCSERKRKLSEAVAEEKRENNKDWIDKMNKQYKEMHF